MLKYTQADLEAARAPLLAEIERLRADLDNMLWNLGGISTLACSRTPTGYDKSTARPALNDVAKLVEDYAELRAKLEKAAALAESEVYGRRDGLAAAIRALIEKP